MPGYPRCCPDVPEPVLLDDPVARDDTEAQERHASYRGRRYHSSDTPYQHVFSVTPINDATLLASPVDGTSTGEVVHSFDSQDKSRKIPTDQHVNSSALELALPKHRRHNLVVKAAQILTSRKRFL